MSKMRYEIVSVIKESNKGNVYLSKIEGYAFPVIVKQLKYGNRAVYEALKEIKNEHIPLIYHVEETEDGLLVAEEYIEGEVLSDYLVNQTPKESECLDIAKQLCIGLKELHNHVPPLIHRDIKPSNIIVNSKGIVKIIDYDSSRLYKAESEGDTRLLGTEKYAPPEQYGFSQTDCRSDIYSLGVVLGMLPQFATETKNRRCRKLVEKCTLFAPESRFQTVEEVEREIKKIEKAGISGRGKVGAIIAAVLILCGVLFGVSGKGKNPGGGIVLSSTPVSELTLALTPMPTITPTPDLLSKPTPTLLPLELGEPVVYATRADSGDTKLPLNCPEARVTEEDSSEVAELKKTIECYNAYVQYYFKDRMQKDDLLTYTSFLDDARESFLGVRLYSYQTGEWMRLSYTEAMEIDGICHIDGQYMDRLPDGFYHLVIQMRFAGDKGIREHSVYLYVAESDTFNEPISYIEGNYIGYRGENDVTLHTIIRNSFDRRIVSVQWEWGDDLDPSLYKILYGGRAVEYSAYLLEKVMETGKMEVYLKLSDGTREQIRILIDLNIP